MPNQEVDIHCYQCGDVIGKWSPSASSPQTYPGDEALMMLCSKQECLDAHIAAEAAKNQPPNP